jgi:hypothetical protein
MWMLGGAIGGFVGTSVAAIVWLPNPVLPDYLGCCFGGACFGAFAGYLPAIGARLMVEHTESRNWFPFWTALVMGELAALLVAQVARIP